MKKITLLACLLAGLSASAQAAQGTVSYQCQGGKKVSIQYQFDDGTGLPVQAVIQGKKPQTVYYDPSLSDEVGSHFGNEAGYKLGAEALTINGYKQSRGVMVTNGRDEIVYKNCNPTGSASSPKKESKKQGDSSRVRYMCQNQRALNVDYGFDAYGQAVRATVNVNGKKLVLKHDVDASDRVSTVFVGQGYRLTGGAELDKNNVQHESGIKLMAPNGKILNKDCSPH